MNPLLTSALVLAGWAGLTTAKAQAPSYPKSYTCYRAAKNMTIDGRMNEKAWKKAPWTEQFVDIEGDKKPLPLQQTRVKMLWDDQFLYIAAQMDEEHIWAYQDKKDQIVYLENDFEVFIDPDGDTDNYYELEVNAINNTFDLFLPKPYRKGGRAQIKWDIQNLKTAVSVDGTVNNAKDKDKRWIVEMAIPFESLSNENVKPVIPHAGSEWRINFSRVNWQHEIGEDGRYARKRNPETGKVLPEYNWVWSPQGLINMHYPEYWGKLIFSNESQPGSRTDVRTDAELTDKLKAALAGFHGQAGVYVRNLKTNRVAAVNADSLYPTASMIKVPIMCGIFDKIEKGEVKFNQELVYRDSLKYDNGIVGSFRDSTKIALPKVVHLMISQSDNTGSLWLQAMAGGGATINQWLSQNGFANTRVNSRTPGRKEFQAKYGWGVTTPREMAELVAMIRDGKAISPAASERMYRYLGMQFWDGEAISQVPSDIKVASKTGAVNEARSEVLVVHAPHGDYVLCIATKNQADQSWQKDNEGYLLIRKISNIIWDHFEPKRPWKPAEGSDRFWF